MSVIWVPEFIRAMGFTYIRVFIVKKIVTIIIRVIVVIRIIRLRVIEVTLCLTRLFGLFGFNSYLIYKDVYGF